MDNKKHESEMLLKLLLNGGKVEHEGRTYAMSEDNRMVLVCKSTEGDEVLVNYDCDVSQFVELSESIGRDKLWLQLCGAALRRES